MNSLLKPKFLHYVKKECEKKLKSKYSKSNLKNNTTERIFELDNIQSSDINESSMLTAEQFAKAVGIDILNRKKCQRSNRSYRCYNGLYSISSNANTIDYGDISNKDSSSVFDESFFKNPIEEEKTKKSSRRRSPSTTVLSSFYNNYNTIYENKEHSCFKRSDSTNSVSTCVNSNCSDSDSEIEYPENENSLLITNPKSINSSFMSSSSQYTLKNSFSDNQNTYSYNVYSYHSLPCRKPEISYIQNGYHTIHSTHSSHSSKFKITKSVTFSEGTRYFEFNIKPMIPDEVKVYKKGRFTITREISRHS